MGEQVRAIVVLDEDGVWVAGHACRHVLSERKRGGLHRVHAAGVRGHRVQFATAHSDAAREPATRSSSSTTPMP